MVVETSIACRCETTDHWCCATLVGTENEKRPPWAPTVSSTPDGPAPPGRHDPRHARLLPVQGRRGPGHLRGQGASRCAAACRTTSATRTCRRARRRWWRRPSRSSGSRSATRSRPSCWSTASSSGTGPGSTSGCATTRATRSSPSPSTRSGPGPMVMRGASARASATSGPYAHAYAIRDTARPAAAHVPDPHVQRRRVPPPRAARPAVPPVPHREVLGALRRRDRQAERVRRARRGADASFLDGDTEHDRQPARDQDARRRRRAGVRAGRPPARPADAPSARRSRSSRWSPTARGPRRGRPSADDDLEAAGAGVLRPPGPGASAARASSIDKVEDLGARRAGRPDARGPLRRRAGRSACPSWCWCPGPEPRLRDLYEEWLARQRGSVRRRSGCPSGATSGRCTETVTRNAKEEFARHRLRRASGPQQPGQGAQRAAGPPRSARGAAADRVLRHEPHPGQRLRRLDGRARGRPRRTSPSTGASRSRGAGQRRLRGDGGGAAPGASRPTWPSATSRPPSDAGQVRRTRRSSLLVDGGKGQLGVAVRVLEELGLAGRDPVASAGQAVRGGLRARPGRAGRASPRRPRRCTCCSGSATRPTASPSPSTASCGASA